SHETYQEFQDLQTGRTIRVENQSFDRVLWMDMAGRKLGDWEITSQSMELPSHWSGIYLGYFYSSTAEGKAHIQKVCLE
ncbi:MAG: hypothetical protein K2Q22_04835, partial [Cytophagales bacterium]|nr:hypothetical protein [Cytophagales bacterium]